ncbi:MAG: sigma-70 family RNA polymerase sigma factor [Tannerellaceae bacterium]|jgi:RNA polymerase sigma-70 factor (ECF subfamily)|nr:sigma-70 family RNA polymerase sigma factor [Tannerellaceae bacterium]
MLSETEFKSLFSEHFDAIRTYIFYRCGDTITASDVAQDVFLRIWEKRNSLNPDNIKALLYKIASDAYVSNYRKICSQMNFQQSMSTEIHTEPSPEDIAMYNETAAAYSSAIEQMPEMQRTVFLMHREDEMKYREIAECLSISVKTVEKHISAALRLMRSKLL